MGNQNFTNTITVEQSPEDVFDAINNVRGWWSKNIEGKTDEGNSAFIFRDKYLTVQMKITHFTPQKTVWKVVESQNDFFLTTSLKSLIETGKGKGISNGTASFTTSITVNNSSKEVYEAINNVRSWWSEEIEGDTGKLNAAFCYHYKDVHLSKMEIVELIPGEKVVWFVKDNTFNFVKDKTEWKGTKIIFEIEKKGSQTRLKFTHHGLVPEYECYDVCKDAWTGYIQGSLKNLITKGQGKPNAKEVGLSKELIEEWGLPEK